MEGTHTCILAEGSQDIRRCVSNIGLAKGADKALSHSVVALPLLCARCPALQKLGSDPLVVPADERIRVVDGGAVHWEPRHSPSTPVRTQENQGSVIDYHLVCLFSMRAEPLNAQQEAINLPLKQHWEEAPNLPDISSVQKP